MTRDNATAQMARDDPVGPHARYFAETLRQLAAFARAQARPVLLLGSAEVDDDTLLSSPAKGDWGQFYPWSSLRLWRHAERQAYGALAQPSTDAGARVHYVDLGAVVARYPGVRCDGMHFGSEFANYSAYAEVLAAKRRQLSPAVAQERAPQELAAPVPSGSGKGAPADCLASDGVLGFALLRALEAAGLLECVGQWTWHETDPMHHHHHHHD